MSQPKPLAQPSGLNLQDILYVLFRHKWKIVISSTLGCLAAATVFLFYPTVYESQAKLLVRYVVDKSAIDQVDSHATAGPSNENLLTSEAEIVKSWDLAAQAAKAIGVERLDSKSSTAPEISRAAQNIQSGLTVTPIRGSNIISVSYRNRDPQLAAAVLKELVTLYFTKHLEVHRSADAFNFVSQQSDEVRARLRQTEENLKRLKDKAGITSLSESSAILNTELARTREGLKAAEADRADQQAVLKEMEKPLPGRSKTAGSTTVANNEIVQQYQSIIARLANLRQTDLELVSRYTQKTDGPKLLDEIQWTRQVYRRNDQPRDSATQFTKSLGRERPFVGAERNEALNLARERYRRQNDTGFSYHRSKKNFDVLVKEAEQELIKKKIDDSLVFKASEDELARLSELQKLNQVQIENLEKQRTDFELKYPGLAATLPSTSEDLKAEMAAERGRLVAIANERARLAGMQARIEALKSHLDDIREQDASLPRPLFRLSNLSAPRKSKRTITSISKQVLRRRGLTKFWIRQKCLILALFRALRWPVRPAVT